MGILLYADDIALIANSEGELQTLLNALEQWGKHWQLKVNNLKTNIVHFRNRGKKCTQYLFTFDDKELNKVNQYKYLGFWLNENLKYEESAEILSEAGSRALGTIIGKFKSIKNITYDTFTKLYSTSVLPVIDYASEIWGFSKALSCDKVQHKAMRYFLGVHKFCPLPAMCGDMGWLDSRSRRFLNMLKFWNRLVAMSENRLTKKLFTYDYENSNLGADNWCKEIESVLDEVNMLNIYVDKSICPIEVLENKLYCYSENIWIEKCKNMPKLRTYILFKDKFQTEPYLKTL